MRVFFSTSRRRHTRYGRDWSSDVCSSDLTGSMFPKSYKNAIIVARHGSWNRSKKVGGDVVVVKLNKDGTVKSMEPLITGFLEDNKYIGRPVDVMQMKDGSLLVSDDWNGAVYRVTYGKPKVAAQ